MKRIWQAVVIFWVALVGLRADEVVKPLLWVPLKIQASAFSSDLGMLDAERQEYATNLANCAATGIVQAKASAGSLEEARRLLTLALNLSPRNKRSIIVNFQLGKGLLPEVAKGDYSPQVLARLLLTRGQLLTKQESSENLLLARMFFQLAAELDAKNEDAVYASEVDRLDHGSVDWALLTRPRPSPEAVPTPDKELVKEPLKETVVPRALGPHISPPPRP
ncbi:MAG: hypothetical protein DVB25_02955 [Verrucomicrobia bacterium]|nr:MAG: hypothetical protein DVB25_02955 [Verrucomicrobiota bacterium]